MKHYLLFYDVVDDYLARRAALRPDHLEHAQRAQERGELLLAGALAEPVDGAVLLFRGPSPEVAERFAEADPYVTKGLVTDWRVREWTTVAGTLLAASRASQAVSDDEVVRVWRGVTASREDARSYSTHLERDVLPSLSGYPGYRGVEVLRRDVGSGVEFMVTTRWESMEALRAFAGDEPERAVVAPAARAVLSEYDETVRHYAVARADAGSG